MRCHIGGRVGDVWGDGGPVPQAEFTDTFRNTHHTHGNFSCPDVTITLAYGHSPGCVTHFTAIYVVLGAG